MIRMVILYCAVVGIPALVLLGRGLVSQGNRWPLSGTPVDYWLQTLGPWAALIAAFPLIVLTVAAARIRYRRAVLVSGAMAVAIGLLVLALVFVAHD